MMVMSAMLCALPGIVLLRKLGRSHDPILLILLLFLSL